MSCNEVAHSEKWFALRPVSPMGFVTRFVPGSCWSDKLIVFFVVVRAVIAGLAKVFGKAFYVFGKRSFTSHIVCAECCRIYTCNDSAAGRCAYAGMAEYVFKTSALRSEFIDIRSNGVRPAITAKMRADVLAGYPEKVRASLLFLLFLGREQ